jgi:hypothetical protein
MPTFFETAAEFGAWLAKRAATREARLARLIEASDKRQRL